MELRGSPTYSQVTCPGPKPDESSQRPPILL